MKPIVLLLRTELRCRLQFLTNYYYILFEVSIMVMYFVKNVI